MSEKSQKELSNLKQRMSILEKEFANMCKLIVESKSDIKEAVSLLHLLNDEIERLPMGYEEDELAIKN